MPPCTCSVSHVCRQWCAEQRNFTAFCKAKASAYRAVSVYSAVVLVLILLVTASVVAQCTSSTSDPESGVYIP
jgi:hypothetical protein